jgi:hypothetical protein
MKQEGSMARGRTAAAAAPQPSNILFVTSLDASCDEMIEAICMIYRRLGADFNNEPLAIAGLGNMSRRRVQAQYRLARRNAKRAGVSCVDHFRQLPKGSDPMEIDFE